MILNRLYICILTICKALVRFYDNSFIGRAVGAVCSFFEKRCKQSPILTWFRDSFSNSSVFAKSIFAKAVCLPFDILRGFYSKTGAKIEQAKKTSQALRFLRSWYHVAVCDYALLALCFGLGALVWFAVTDAIFSLMGILSVVFVVFGLIGLFVPSSVKNTFFGSFLVRLVLKILFIDIPEYDTTIIRASHKKTIAILFVLVGFASAYAGLAYVLFALAGVISVIAIMRNTLVGIYLLVATCAILPTMALVALVCLTLLSYAINLAFSKKASYRITPFTILVAVFFFLCAFASFTSVTPKSSIMTLMVYVVFTLSAMLISNTVKTKKVWQSLIAVFAISAFFVSAYGVIQNFFLEQTTQSWVDTEMFEDIKTRVYSTLDNPNVLGQFLILSIPLTFACMLRVKGLFAKTVYAAIMLTSVACLFFTWSRAAWVGVFLALVIMLIKLDRRFVALCVVGAVLLPFVLPQSILSRLTSIGNTGDSSTSYRISVWTASIYMVRDFFFTGVGLGSDAFATMYKSYALGGASFALHAHNFYLQWIADMGIGGLYVYALIILTAYKCISKAGKGKSLTNYVCYAVAGSLVGYLFQGIAETMWYNYHMILIFWIFMAFIETAAHINTTAKGSESDA